jgi:hypothetical protein
MGRLIMARTPKGKTKKPATIQDVYDKLTGHIAAFDPAPGPTVPVPCDLSSAECALIKDLVAVLLAAPSGAFLQVSDDGHMSVFPDPDVDSILKFNAATGKKIWSPG